MLVGCFLFAPPAAQAETPAPAVDMAGEAILFEEIPSVYGASKHEQKVTEAPSAITIITAEEINKYGYRTLGDILQSVKGASLKLRGV
jgi:iron complex outermembrane receptor protein